jgi:hypothetical protein
MQSSKSIVSASAVRCSSFAHITPCRSHKKKRERATDNLPRAPGYLCPLLTSYDLSWDLRLPDWGSGSRGFYGGRIYSRGTLQIIISILNSEFSILNAGFWILDPATERIYLWSSIQLDLDEHFLSHLISFHLERISCLDENITVLLCQLHSFLDLEKNAKQSKQSPSISVCPLCVCVWSQSYISRI